MPKKKFSREEVIADVKAFQAGKTNEKKSKVIEKWLDLADGWLSSSDGNYHIDGFDGLIDRTPEAVVVDFHLNGLLDKELTDQEFNELANVKKEPRPLPPQVVVIKNAVVDEVFVCRDNQHAEEVFKRIVKEKIKDAENYTTKEWNDLLDDGYHDSPSDSYGSICITHPSYAE